MRKNLQKIFITAAAVAFSSGGIGQLASATTAEQRVENTYYEPFSIMTIFPDSNTLSVHYYGVNDPNEEMRTNFLNIFSPNLEKISEKEADADFQNYVLAAPEWGDGYYNKRAMINPNTETATRWSIMKYNNTNTEISLKDRIGILYYVVRLDNGKLLTGKADYRDCLSSEYYQEGAACKLEKFSDSGELYYWPYLNDVRLGPDNEPVEEISEEDTPKEETPPEEETPAIKEPEEETPTEEVPEEKAPEKNISKEDISIKETAIETKISENGLLVPKIPDTGQNNHNDDTSASLAYLILPMLGLIGVTILWSILVIKRKNRK